MKNNTLLLTFFLVLSAYFVSAQKRLSPGIRPYAENWTYTLVNAMHRAGFDMPTKAAAPAANGVVSRNALQLDSTKTFFGYNLNGPGDSTPLSRTTYQYPQAETKVEYNYQWENNAWLTLNRSTLISDDQQRLVEITAEAFDPVTQTFLPDSRLLIFPHGDSQDLVDSFATYLWDSTIMDWHVILISRNTFDAQDRLIESVNSLDYFGDPAIFKEIYYYDDNGDNHLIEEFAILGNDVFPSSKTEISYADHRPIEVTYSVSDGFDFIKQSRSNYAYTLFGALRLHLSFEWNVETDNWKMTKRIEYGFDAEQRVASMETTIDPTSTSERELVTYAYVEDENLALVMTFHFDDDLFDWVLDTKKYYYYNGVSSLDPTPGPAQALVAWPNPTTGLVQLAFDAEADIRVFDAAGQLVQSRRVQQGQTALDMSALPAGIYSVTAQQNADFYSGKIVKQ